MRLLTPAEILQFTLNGRQSAGALERRDPLPDHWPVVRLIAPTLGCAWLASEIHDRRKL